MEFRKGNDGDSENVPISPSADLSGCTRIVKYEIVVIHFSRGKQERHNNSSCDITSRINSQIIANNRPEINLT